ncbi:MAG TPA: phenylphosphate carboxylase subunit delta [Gallionella sp.]|jgi:3-deoxy-D-manno-octulosonate 8-phosphate phosphatase (KDO 8-P phosphatase)|nr:phenylphosphate carboxylase subunit delta [Gallionella sp.]OGR06480.1 MAG: phenylphosphate carboxylase subunit delta [Deltaproteobacteria bacterium RIFOXYD12_FULL_50_9]OGS66355.1 MAG: phenylphosphate carboxylase subunit delta [Gallionellales bacterium GWA2_54_124]HCI52683.1 phenylphosphate carboxylase subunit delta [Gallionella sp.]
MFLSRAKLIRLVAFDVDGVMTDGGLFLSDSGEEFKRFNSLDGHGIKMLRASGVEVAIITGRTSRCVEMRAQNLGIAHVYQGVERKLEAMVDLLGKLQLSRDAAAYMGDDVVDLCVMRHVGLAITVPESPQLVQAHSHYMTKRSGGYGAVREVCELIMSAQGTLDAQLAPYLK